MSDYTLTQVGPKNPNLVTGDYVAKNYAPVKDMAAHNEAIRQAELTRWAEKPDHQLGYFKFPSEDEFVQRHGARQRADFYPFRNGATISTWAGDILGEIVSARVLRHNFGGRFVAITVQGNNGARYYGRAPFDNSTCINLRKCKKA